MTELVSSVTRLDIAVVKTDPPGLAIEIDGEVATPGWTGFEIEHPIYLVPPADGVYEARMVGEPPGNAIGMVAPFRHYETWAPFPADLRGFRLCSATNRRVAMLE